MTAKMTAQKIGKKLLSCLILLVVLSACRFNQNDQIELHGLTMGTTYSVKIVGNPITLDRTKLHGDIEAILTDINRKMSTYMVDSELSRFNRAKDTNWHTLSADLFTVIRYANRISDNTMGGFDITVGPLVNLWGFGPDPLTRAVPPESVIESTRQYTGYKKLRLDETNRRIAKTNPDIYIDLSAIAKGFAVDKLAEYLDSLKLKDYLVEIGGELVGRGKNINRQTWRIGIEQSGPNARSIQRIINLDNMAMATSGDYRNYFEKDGVRYSHTIDPATGKPVTHHLASATVLAETSMKADALATAFMVLGPEKTMAVANRLNVAVFLIIKTETGFNEIINDHFRPYLTHAG